MANHKCTPRLDLTGRQFGRLTAKSYVPGSSWLCVCDCGKEKAVKTAELINGSCVSCGCFRAQRIGDQQRTHGMGRHRLAGTWSKMKARCLNSNSHNFKYYGGRGIKVCARWMDLENFIADVAPSYPGDGYTLDRIDNNGNYEPTNFRWSTHKQQLRNMRRNRIIEYRGDRKTAADWADYFGISGNDFRTKVCNKGESAALEWAEKKLAAKRSVPCGSGQEG